MEGRIAVAEAKQRLDSERTLSGVEVLDLKLFGEYGNLRSQGVVLVLPVSTTFKPSD